MRRNYRRRYNKKKSGGRGILSTISYFVRQFYFPNPFVNVFEDASTAEVFNWMFGGVFIPLAFLLTRTWYINGPHEKWEGVIGFFVNYFLITTLFLVISKFIADIYWLIGVFVFGYIVLLVVESYICNEHIFN